MARKNSKNVLTQNVMESVIAGTEGLPEMAFINEVLGTTDVTPQEMAEVAAEMVEALPNEDEAVLEVQADEAPVLEDEAPTAPEDDVDFEQIIVAVEPDAAIAMVAKIKSEIAARKAIEIEKGPLNDNIQRTLKNVDLTLARDFAARVLIATNVEPDFLTSRSREGEHYNVYAMGKLNDLVDGLCGLSLKNAINRAIVRSMFALKKKGIAMTREIAEAAASDKIRLKDKTIEALLTRHTVAAVTAPTQTSSTMRALETLGIVKAVGAKNATVFVIQDTPQTRALELVAEALAA